MVDISKNGFGKFTATNGIDTVQAVYARGCQEADGHFHPSWTLELNGHLRTILIDSSKDNAIEEATRLLFQPIDAPLTPEQIQQLETENGGRVYGIVALPLQKLLLFGEQEIHTALCRSLVGDRQLADTSLYAVGCREGEVCIRIEGVLQSSELEPVQSSYDMDGVCPSCGEDIDYLGDQEIIENRTVVSWHCPHCGCIGKSWYDLVFDRHADMTEQDVP